jgi:branched-chain amino acid transport system permease protein
MGATLNATALDSWFGAGLRAGGGRRAVRADARRFVREWGDIQEEIEKEIKRREAL